MESLSNQLLMATILVYLVAMMCYLAEYAFGGRGAVARAATRAPRELAGVGARANGSVAVDEARLDSVSAFDSASAYGSAPLRDAVAAAPVSPAVSNSIASSSAASSSGPPGPAAPGGRAAAFGLVAVGLTVVAALLHGGVLLTRGLAAGRVPWGNMYEFVIALSFVGTVAWLVLVARRPTLRLIGLFVTIALVLVLGFAGVVLYTKVGPLNAALNSYWLKIHVSAAASSSGLLLVAFVPAALFLIRSGFDQGKTRFPYPIGAKLPAADTLERLTFRLHAFAFPIWTFAIICGAIWAESAWGRYWGWDPKEVWSFISWVAYAAYLHARATPSVKRTTATWFVMAAWGTMLINLYVINFVAVGLHGYAGVK